MAAREGTSRSRRGRRAASIAAADPRGPAPVSRADARDGSPSWRILDPVRNSFFEIGWLEFELLARWRAQRDADALLAQVAAETPLQPSAEELKDLIDFLATNQLLAPQQRDGAGSPGRRMRESKHAWYLQAAAPLPVLPRCRCCGPTRSSPAPSALTDVFFTRGFVVLVLVLLGLDLYLVSREWYSVTDAMSRMFTPQRVPLLRDRGHASPRSIHELAHAYAARRYGVRVPTMGVAFLVLWPFLYTDTSETWKLADRRKQLVIASAGMASELVLAVFSTLLWALAPEGGAKNVLFVLASTTWVVTLADQPQPVHALRRLFRAVGPARLPQPARARRRLRALVDAQDLLRPGRAAARAGPAPAAARRADRVRLDHVGLPADGVPRHRAARLPHRLQAARHLPDVRRADLVHRPADLAGGRLRLEERAARCRWPGARRSWCWRSSPRWSG